MGANMAAQDLASCAELREACQTKVFNHVDARFNTLSSKMDQQHQEVRGSLDKINQKLAYREGRDSAGAGSRWDDKLWIKVLLTWGGPIAFLILLGLITWLKAEGWW